AVLTVATPASVTTPQRRSSNLSSSATANGTVIPKGSPGNAGFLYGTTSTLSFQSSTFTGWQTIPADFNVHALSALLSPLLSGKIYYFRLVFVNGINSSYQYGAVLSVATPASVTTTQAATAITSSSAMAHGTVNPKGSPGNAGFLYRSEER